MKAYFDSEVWEVADYVEHITDDRPCYNDLKSMEADFQTKGLDLWNYPLNEIEHIIENELKVCLVRFENMYGGYEYRWCEFE